MVNSVCVHEWRAKLVIIAGNELILKRMKEMFLPIIFIAEIEQLVLTIAQVFM